MNRLEAISAMGCIICGGPAEIHHCITGRFSQRRASDDETIPLCAYHHRTGPRGAAIHAGKHAWLYDEAQLLSAVNATMKGMTDE